MTNHKLICLAKAMGKDLFYITILGALSGSLIIAQCFFISLIIDAVFLKGQ